MTAADTMGPFSLFIYTAQSVSSISSLFLHPPPPTTQPATHPSHSFPLLFIHGRLSFLVSAAAGQDAHLLLSVQNKWKEEKQEKEEKQQMRPTANPGTSCGARLLLVSSIASVSLLDRNRKKERKKKKRGMRK